MNIVEVYAPFTAELASSEYLTGIRTTYKDQLVTHAVPFLNPEQQAAKIRYRAWAACLRGEYVLDADGAPVTVDTDTYDFEADGDLAFGSPAARNETQLESLVDMDLFAKAGTLAVERARSMDTLDEDDVADLEALNSRYKHFVQAGMAVERWGDAWIAAVDWGFPGNSLDFPLDAEGILYAGSTLFDKQFSPIYERHFKQVSGMVFNLATHFNVYDTRAMLRGRGPGRLATIAALFYASSPEGVAELLTEGARLGRLPAGINWRDRVRRIVAKLGYA